MTPVCDNCGRERTIDDVDYSPLQVIYYGPIGWYSGVDGQICPECMTEMIERQ
jgi:hypothetical protein